MYIEFTEMARGRRSDIVAGRCEDFPFLRPTQRGCPCDSLPVSMIICYFLLYWYTDDLTCSVLVLFYVE